MSLSAVAVAAKKWRPKNSLFIRVRFAGALRCALNAQQRPPSHIAALRANMALFMISDGSAQLWTILQTKN
jgi:hypothetical protein